ncbi:hypothetical protein MHUMG1_10183 [Metarhizium humberi]|uniref:Peptidase S1 domain-containing protein n=1 Tax=Metarhizium humberi TaxID=2596975 RepID=A0A9P8M192_9HYPO|nr:hypothetical protein MHUMG1_10183 [Metarhizium humberi]
MVRPVISVLVVAFSAISAAATINKRIYAGEPAKEGEVPFMIHFDLACGGSLLDKTTVLTAAHCLAFLQPGNTLSVRAGTLDSITGGVVAEAACFKTHPEYYPGRSPTGLFHPNDIAMVRLSSPIEKSNVIDYATLPANGSDPAVGSLATVAGWGERSSAWDSKLHKVVIPIQERKLCSDIDKGAPVRDTIVCAGGDGKGSCDGDSGGPLIDQSGQLIGIVSVARKCGLPLVYTRVGSYIPFISENLDGSGPGVCPDGWTKFPIQFS